MGGVRRLWSSAGLRGAAPVNAPVRSPSVKVGRQRDDLPRDAPWSPELERVLHRHPLPGNLRDLQRLAVLTMAWWSDADAGGGLRDALREWERWSSAPIERNAHFGEGTRTERIRWFRQQLAQWAKEQHGTWAAASAALGCDEKTLRQDAPEGDSG